MFWGSFSGQLGLGPALFWEKNWGSINSVSYIEHILPQMANWIRYKLSIVPYNNTKLTKNLRQHPELTLMQNNASSHGSKATRAALQDLGITACSWPAFSPNLNPIESLWDLIKNWIADNYVMEDLKDYKVLRKALTEAWNSITEAQLDHLIDSMHARCEAVIAANGMQTKY